MRCHTHQRANLEGKSFQKSGGRTEVVGNIIIMQTYDSIGLAGATVGVVNLDSTKLKWSPRHKDDASPETILIENILRAAWAPVGKICHLRLWVKSGEKYRLDGFRKTDIEGLKSFFEEKVFISSVIFSRKKNLSHPHFILTFCLYRIICHSFICFYSLCMLTIFLGY